MNNQILNILKNINSITSVNEITFDSLRPFIDDPLRMNNLEQGSSLVWLFEFSYTTDNVVVFGYLSVPRNIDFNIKHSAIVALRGGN